MSKDTCGAGLIIGDDHGDNSCTFKCQLRPNHVGMHSEYFRHDAQGIPHVEIYWNGDDLFKEWLDAWREFFNMIGPCAVHGFKDQYDYWNWEDAEFDKETAHLAEVKENEPVL